MLKCYCSNNIAGNLIGGSIYVSEGFVSVLSSIFINNTGGVIRISEEGSIFSVESYYEGNTAHNGGVMYVNYGSVHNANSSFINNSATNGGAIYFKISGNLLSETSSFVANTAKLGGAIFAGSNSSLTTSANSHFQNNLASVAGGAIYSLHGAINSSRTQFTNNTSSGFGGAVLQYMGNIFNWNTRYVSNRAYETGGAICSLFGSISINNSLFIYNHAEMFGGAIYTDSCSTSRNLTRSVFDASTLICPKFVTNDDFNAKYSILREDIFLSTKFINNTSEFVGGAITSVMRGTTVNGFVIISGNTAQYGGGLALAGGTLGLQCPLTIQANVVTDLGGGIYAYKMKISLQTREELTINTTSQYSDETSVNNTTVEKGHGFLHNGARLGGAIYLDQNSKLHLIKRKPDKNGEYSMKLKFSGNVAQYGGALYISDRQENKLACVKGVPGNQLVQGYVQECFIQILLTNYSEFAYGNSTNFINVFFTNNTASQSGDDIYGGLLDRCVLNPSAELVIVFPEHATYTGYDYIRATAEFNGLVDYNNLTSPYNADKLINAISMSNVKGLISSEPLRVCFCLDSTPNCSYHHQTVYTKRGQLFHLSVLAVDQVGNPINATVISSFISNNGDLNVDQARQDTYAHCTELEYTVYPKGNSESTQLELYADGPCTDIGISKRVLDVVFLPCTCPVGFHPVETETLCRCECDPKLRQYTIACSNENETILLDTNAWIDYVNSSSESGYIIHKCPFDYCVQEPVIINLNIPNGADMQCAYNRSGKLCGACKENLSLLMGSSHCGKCSNNFLSLIIPFALTGVALVAFILILNMTVATGTTHGLIFYANILAASRSSFLLAETPVFLNIFVSWINLDLGIETCFYNGMDSYAKVLFQLAFPTYIILLSILIIVISEHSIRFATLIGRRDPVATLSTLILLSYSKLIRTIISSLQYTYLDYPNGSREIVWLYDANVPYFKPSHIPRFLTASIIVVLGSVYTLLLFFGQWIPRCGNRCVRWANNPKYNEFIVKYHAPFNPKHRYWMGMLLFARILHYVVAAFVSESANLVSVICIVLCLVTFKVIIARRAYKNWSLNTLETSFLLNLGIFAAVTYYLSQDAKGSQTALNSVSLGCAFLMFVGILVYHFYTYTFKGTQLWKKITRFLQRINNARKRRPIYQHLPEPDDDGEENGPEIEMQPPYTNDDNEPMDLPCDYDPPVITPAVRYSQERKELDVLDSITDSDYRQINEHPVPRPRQVPTSTVIDVIRRGQGDKDCGQ